MLSVPGAKTVRGYSFFGDSFVYVLFEDGTDLYWARSRVLEYLNQVQSRLPAAAQGRRSGPTRPAWAGSTSTRSSIAAGSIDLAQLRALQDWFLKYELKTRAQRRRGGERRRHGAPVPGRARSRTGLRAYSIPHDAGRSRRSSKANQETGGSVLELGEAEYMVRASGYLQSLDDFRRSRS